MPLTGPLYTQKAMLSTYVDSIEAKCAANQTFYLGALVATNSAGFLVPGSTATTLKAVGVIIPQPNQVLANSYASASPAGTTTLKVGVGAFWRPNSATDPVSQDEVNEPCYIEDDEFVSATATGKSIAGKVLALNEDASLVLVAIGTASA